MFSFPRKSIFGMQSPLKIQVKIIPHIKFLRCSEIYVVALVK